MVLQRLSDRMGYGSWSFVCRRRTTLNHNDMEWIYDFVHEVVFYEVYESDMAEDYEWVTDRDFAEIVNEVTEAVLDEYGNVSDPDWRIEEEAHLFILDYMSSHIG